MSTFILWSGERKLYEECTICELFTEKTIRNTEFSRPGYGYIRVWVPETEYVPSTRCLDITYFLTSGEEEPEPR